MEPLLALAMLLQLNFIVYYSVICPILHCPLLQFQRPHYNKQGRIQDLGKRHFIRNLGVRSPPVGTRGKARVGRPLDKVPRS